MNLHYLWDSVLYVIERARERVCVRRSGNARAATRTRRARVENDQGVGRSGRGNRPAAESAGDGDRPRAEPVGRAKRLLHAGTTT